MSRLAEIRRDEQGTTLVELMVGLAAGLTVLAGLVILIMATLNTTTRVSARIHATQEGRIALTRVIDQLHSACIAPKVPPIRSGSSGSELRFVHATGSAVVPVPVLTTITYASGSLTQRDYQWKEGSAPFWIFKTTPSRTALISDRIAPIGSKPVFSYYGYASGAVSTTPLSTPLSELNASNTIQVTVSFMSEPRSGKPEQGAAARMQGSASLRLTASSYNPAAPSRPCE